MKKISILLLAVVAISLTSCGGSEAKCEAPAVDSVVVVAPVTDSATVVADTTKSVETTTVK